MLFSVTSLVAAASLAASVVAHPSANAHSHSHASKHAKRDGHVIVTGAAGLGDGQTHARLEVSNLATRHDQWSLFVVAMAKFTAGDSNDLTGYFQVAGIHGVPRQSWDGVEQCQSCNGADGYCTHDNILFPAFHRAYMALYEQAFLKVALDVAQTYSGEAKDRMTAAASTLRFPYWDWAAQPDSGEDCIPSILTTPQILVETPSGNQSINNPLYSYDFQSQTDSQLVYGPFTTWEDTLRWPSSNDPSATSGSAGLTSAMNNLRPSLKDQVYQLETVCNDYTHFSNDAASSSSSLCSTSLEAIHNTIHTTTGGPGSGDVSSGHMAYLSLASFDPLFWLHHCNVDRLFAIWQTLHPDSYGGSQVATRNTWTIAAGSTQDENSPLEPFHKSQDAYWTTNDVKDWTVFGYTYPEYLATDGSKGSVLSLVNGLYGSSSSLTAGAVSDLVEKESKNKVVQQSSSSSSSVAPSTSSVASSTSSVESTTSSVAATTAAPTSSSVYVSTTAPVETKEHVTKSSSLVFTSQITSSAVLPASSQGSSGGLLGGLLGGIGGEIGGVVSGLDGLVSKLIPTGLFPTKDVIPTQVPGITLPSIAIPTSLPLGGLLPTGALPTGLLPSAGAGGWNLSLPNIIPSIPLPSLNESFLTPNGSQYQYLCNINTPRYALNGSYTIYLFNGQPTTNVSDWFADSNFIGAVGVLGGGMGGMTMTDDLISASIPLTRTLQDSVLSGLLPSMGEDHIIPHLTDNLIWKIAQAGSEVAVNAVDGFKAAVFSSTSSANTIGELPEWSAPVPQVQVTEQKDGGATCADEESDKDKDVYVTATTTVTTTVCPCTATASATGYARR